MMTMEKLIVLVGTVALVSGEPQDLFFPDESPDRFPTSSTPTLPPVTGAVSNNPAVTTTTIRSTRIPPRDPGNRIVYLVSCDCKFTYEYSPVCGTDGQTYGNIGVLRCTRQCGKNVDLYLVGACGSNNG
ncbi:uncharacterized protein LOC128987239 [Macrosteles quadrilineatus]|uniref:uncharacterized protein LOC128987239 n=1 Tax=Macrosteles quadrilineatus TaxID=74068 RepID=UPI0023E0BB75|nr:uncharacterized protein LOC128987239 [Macrosteles quadrilineatus]